MPDTATQITGIFHVCKPDSGLVFSTVPLNYAQGYHWEVPPGFVITSGQNTTSITVKVAGPAVSGNISVYGTNYCGNGEPAIVGISVHEAITPVITGNDSLCDNFQDTYTTQAGMSDYHWTLSPGCTILAGGSSTSDFVTVHWFTNGANWAEVNFTNSFGCSDSLPTRFNVWVSPLNLVNVGIVASTNPFCVGNSVTYTATPGNEGPSPVYLWKVNGINVLNSNNAIYTYSPSSGDIVECALTSNLYCVTGNPATSNAIVMAENLNLPVSVLINTSTSSICDGTPVTFTAVPTNGGTIPSYQWKVNGINATGATNSVYNYTPVNGDVMTCELVSNLFCATGNPATSNPITMVVNPNLPVSISIAPS